MAYFTSPNLLFVFLILAQQGFALTFTSQFQHCYPQYAIVWEETLRQNCSKQYAEYLTGNRDPSKIDWISGGGYFSILTQPVVQCLLDNISEYNKSAVTCAQVLLGIMPTVLSLLSARYEELAMLVIVSHRPILSTLLALGSPSVFLSRAFDYYSPTTILERKEGRLAPWQPTGLGRWVVTIMEYAVAMAAVVNVAHVCYQLGLQSFTSLWGDSVLMPMLWAMLVLPIHIFGVISMRLRIRRDTGYTNVNVGGSTRKGRMEWFRNTPQPFKRLWRTEITPSVAQSDICITFLPESWAYIGLSWWLSLGTICYIIFGTFMMSSFLFVGPLNALSVAGRLILSVVTCRTIIMYEISGIREVYTSTNEQA